MSLCDLRDWKARGCGVPSAVSVLLWDLHVKRRDHWTSPLTDLEYGLVTVTDLEYSLAASHHFLPMALL